MSAASRCPIRAWRRWRRSANRRKSCQPASSSSISRAWACGASRGEGLGNQFLAHIREVDAIIHVLRCFEDADITHVEGGIDPLRDAEIVETELMLADLDSLEKRLPALLKRGRGGDREAAAQAALIEPIIAALQEGRPARTAIPRAEAEAARRLDLLTAKPVLYVCNVAEADAATGNEATAAVADRAAAEGPAPSSFRPPSRPR